MRIFYILSIILLSAVQVKSQSHTVLSHDPDTVSIKFYPNPAISTITFDFQKANNKSYSFQIFNFIGKKVYEAAAVDQKTIVNLSDFFRGIYIFQLRDENGRVVQSGKFQVVK